MAAVIWSQSVPAHTCLRYPLSVMMSLEADWFTLSQFQKSIDGFIDKVSNNFLQLLEIMFLQNKTGSSLKGNHDTLLFFCDQS